MLVPAALEATTACKGAIGERGNEVQEALIGLGATLGARCHSVNVAAGSEPKAASWPRPSVTQRHLSLLAALLRVQILCAKASLIFVWTLGGWIFG